MSFTVTRDKAALFDVVVRHVLEVYEQAVEGRGVFHLTLTGGSTPGPIHRLLREEFGRALDPKKVHIWWGDERAVAADHEYSNFGAACKDFLNDVSIPQENIHRMIGESTDLPAEARRYEHEMRYVCNGEVDLMFVGMGKDTHILSLFPGSPHIISRLDVPNPMVVASLDPPMNPAVSRITCTPSALLSARQVVVLAAGKDKAEAVQLAVEAPEDLAKHPVHLLRRVGYVHWFVDAEAGARLRRPEQEEEP